MAINSTKKGRVEDKRILLSKGGKLDENARCWFHIKKSDAFEGLPMHMHAKEALLCDLYCATNGNPNFVQ